MRKNGYQLYKCDDCHLMFYDFHNDYKSFLEMQYSKGYFTGEDKLRSYADYGKDKPYIVRNHAGYLKELMRFKKSGKLLDVGCAYGFFLELADRAGFDVYGIDPSGYAVSQAQKKFGKKVQCTQLSESDFPPKSFGVITLFDVFEHLENPKKDLTTLHKMLADDGLLVVATGDTSSFWANFTGRKWTFYNPPQHIFYFNQENITRIFNESGFHIHRTIRTGKWLSLRYVVHLARTVGESKLASMIDPFINKTLFGYIPLYLKINDNMVVFAQKK